MTTLYELIKTGYNNYRKFAEPISYQDNSQRFYGLEVKASNKMLKYNTVAHSNYLSPIEMRQGRLAGYGRGWGQASSETQYKVMDLILHRSAHLSAESQAVLLAIARVESGFNPDAAATSTSASGVFQIVKKTAGNLGLSQQQVFDADKNISAGIRLFENNLDYLNKRFPNLTKEQSAIMLYALHHDGPSLSYGGAEIAKKQILPYLDDFRSVSYGRVFGEVY